MSGSRSARNRWKFWKWKFFSGTRRASTTKLSPNDAQIDAISFSVSCVELSIDDRSPSPYDPKLFSPKNHHFDCIFLKMVPKGEDECGLSILLILLNFFSLSSSFEIFSFEFFVVWIIFLQLFKNLFGQHIWSTNFVD